MDQLAADLRFALRLFRNSPGFTLVAVVTLALGIGANTAIFSFVNAVLLSPLPFPHPEQIVNVWEEPPGGGRNGISTLNFLDWKNQNASFTAMAAQTWGPRTSTLTGSDAPVELHCSLVSAPYFDIFGVKPVLGRAFAPDEDQPGKQYEVVLSHRIWVERFGADPRIIGRKISLSGEPYTIIGVMPPGNWDREWQDIWMPLAFTPQQMTRDYHWMISWARLKPGVTLEHARQDMKTIGSRIERDYPKSNKGWSVAVDRYQDNWVGNGLRESLLILLGAVGAVLLIACANLANLLLVRGAGREREVAIRSALGAARGRVVRQFLTESLLLATVGGCAGVAIGWALMVGLKAWIPPDLLPAEANVTLDGQVLFFTAAIVIATGILFGIAPALHGAHTDLVESLREGGRSATTGARRARMRNMLAVAEIALAFVLLSGAGLLLRSLYALENVDPGFDATNAISIGLPMTSEQYPDGIRINAYLDQIMEKVRAVPGVTEVGATSSPPLEGWSEGMPFYIEGQPFQEMAKRPAANFKRVSPSYLATLQLRLVKGRWLADTDTASSPPVIVVNQTMVKRYFKGEEPLGKIIRIQQIIPGQPALGPEIPWQVVGVIQDEKTELDDSSQGDYVSYKQSPGLGISLVARSAMDPSHLVKSIQAAILSVNKEQALGTVKTLEEIKSENTTWHRLRAELIGAFAALALLLAALGIYGVISYSVAQRTHEMGVRAALGASRWDQLSLVLKDGMALAAVGLAGGVLASLGLTRLLASFLLFGVSPHDPWTLSLVALMVASVAALASFIPARRATQVEPMTALRHE